MVLTTKLAPSSFRDPSGFLFFRDHVLLRQVNESYKAHYDHLIQSGLYEALVRDSLLIPHEEVDNTQAFSEGACKVLRPEHIPFISYPYEWSFSQMKDAALTTLQVQTRAMDFGMTLKDASAYNIQFRKGRPVLIDTLSFEKYEEGKPWIAYRQFCQHFLAPLALMSHTDIRLSQLLRVYVDGIPLDLADSLLPLRKKLRPSFFTHLYLHARSQQRFANKPINVDRFRMSRPSFLGLVDSLESAVRKLAWDPHGTEWADYYDDTNYAAAALEHKRRIISEFLDKDRPKVVWDLGANTGEFSRISGKRGMLTISFDVDPACVERNYRQCSEEGETNVLPLLLDLTNPSPGIGWANQERMSLIERGPADVVLALALVHHLAISNNLPFDKIAGFFSKICHSLIIEFVPKNDSQVQRVLATRKDIFDHYTQDAFINEFQRYFTILESSQIRDSERTLYLMERQER